MAVAIVQQVSIKGDTGPQLTDLASAVTAGNLLVVVGVKLNSSLDGSHVLLQAAYGGSPRAFTDWAWVVQHNAGGDYYDNMHLAYRVATGDEQHLQWIYSDCLITLYEISGAGSPATFEVHSASAQTTSSTKSLGGWTAAGTLQIACYEWGSSSEDGTADQTVGAGWTQDAQDVRGSNHPGYLAMHATSGPTISISGSSHIWAAAAVGITAGVAFQADFTADHTTITAGGTVNFTDLTTGTPTAWSWTFGDAGTSSSQNPAHVYAAAGTYTVALTATKTGNSSTATKTLYITVNPTPAAGVYIDWGNDGFGTGSYDNVSADVMSWVISRGSGPEVIGGATPGSMTLVLKNVKRDSGPDDIYNPYNASGSLYGLLRDGVRVWVGINSDGNLTGSDPRDLFAGRITDITPIPAGGAGSAPTVEIICEDPLGTYQRTPCRVAYDEGRSHAAFRLLALLLAGETRYSLDGEIQTMPLSHADSDLATVLDGINAINGTRHFVSPADNFSDWYSYTTRNRQWRLDATVDSSLSASSQHVTGTDGWRLAADTVINEQEAQVTPVIFTSNNYTVWQEQTLPFSLTTRNPVSKWVTFDDIVRDPVLNIASTGATVVSAITPAGDTALLTLSVASGTATISALSIQGRLARHPNNESYIADDTASQTGPRGIRAGSPISGEYLGVLAEARGIAKHVVYRYASPQLRPTATVENWFPTMFDRDLYDTIAFTSPQLDMSARIFEIVGLTHTGNLAASTAQHHVTQYVWQESRVQANPHWFTLGTSTLGPTGTDILAY